MTEPQENCRIIPTAIGPVIPVIDIGTLLGYSRSAINKIIKEHEGKMTPCKTFAPLPTARGTQQFLCLNREGVDNLMLLIHPAKTRMSDDKFLEFRRDLLNKLDSKKTEVALHPQSTAIKEKDEGWSDVAIEHMKFAGFLTQNSSIDPGLCLAIAIREAERATGKDLTQYKKLIPPASTGYSEYLTVSAIAFDIRMTAEEVNRYLANQGYQFRDDTGTYYLTEKGSDYGRVFPLAARSGHVGYFIKWRREIVEASRMIQNRPVRIR